MHFPHHGALLPSARLLWKIGARTLGIEGQERKPCADASGQGHRPCSGQVLCPLQDHAHLRSRDSGPLVPNVFAAHLAVGPVRFVNVGQAHVGRRLEQGLNHGWPPRI